MEGPNRKFQIRKISMYVCAAVFILNILAPGVYAQTTNPDEPTLNLNDSGFRVVVCDGPTLPADAPNGDWVQTYEQQFKAKYHRDYVACDFKGAMLQVQHIINILLVIGVVISLFGFCWAGFLLIAHGSEPKARSDAANVFKNVAIGFILMLTAWFIVYQVMFWLTGTSGFTALLGKTS